MTDLERKTVEEVSSPVVSDDELKAIISAVVAKLDGFRQMSEHKTRKLARKTVRILRDHGTPGMHVQDSNKSVSPSFWTKRKKLEWMVGQLLEIVDSTDHPIAPVMNVALTSLKFHLKNIDDPVLPTTPFR